MTTGVSEDPLYPACACIYAIFRIAVTTGGIVVEALHGGPWLDAYTIRMSFWTRSEYDGCEIYRSDSADGEFRLIKTENGNPPYYDTGLQPETTYYYKVRLFKGDYFGPLTEAVALTTDSLVAKDFRSRVYPSFVELLWWSWSQYDYAEAFRSESYYEEDFRYYDSTDTASYIDRYFEPGVTYYYKIRLVKDGKAGPFTEVISFTAME